MELQVCRREGVRDLDLGQRWWWERAGTLSNLTWPKGHGIPVACLYLQMPESGLLTFCFVEILYPHIFTSLSI